MFDSGIMAPAATFEHTFTEAGDYPYFCLLHPNMVGTVSVS
jgi:plastocyanin